MLAAVLQILIWFNAVQSTSCFFNAMFAIIDISDAVRAGQISSALSPVVDLNRFLDWLASCG